MKHRIATLTAILVVAFAVLWLAVWSLMTGPLAGFVHPGFQTFYGAFTISFVAVILVAAMAVAAWDIERSAPTKHRHLHFWPLLHH